MTSRTLALVLVALVFVASARAHHSLTAKYDVRDIQDISGTLQSINWVNPHTKWTIDVVNEQGEIESWVGEGAAINTLLRNGITREEFQIGDSITLRGPVSRFGRNEIITVKVFVNDREYTLYPALSNALLGPLPHPENTVLSAVGYTIEPAQAPDLFRVWVPIRFPATGVYPVELPLTDFARTAAESYDPVEDDLAAGCVSAGMPGILDQPYPVEFIDQGDSIVMRFEEWNAVRTIHMTDDVTEVGRGTIYGHSVGRWEDDVLVIETTGVDYPAYNDAGVPMTENMHVTERYWLAEDGFRMNWTATVEDPAIFTEAVSFEGWMAWTPDFQLREFHCEIE